tara:strand:+ start:128 stop:463 length:336 start_codon:yes stop_codon:yes gene_type:complete
MPFIRKTTNSYPWPVEVRRPSSESPGEYETFHFTAIFKRLSKSELVDFQSATDEGKALQNILLGWKDVTEEDGTDIPFTKATLKEFSEDIDFINGVFEAYRKFYERGTEGN